MTIEPTTTELRSEGARPLHDDGFGRCECCGGSTKFGDETRCSGCLRGLKECCTGVPSEFRARRAGRPSSAGFVPRPVGPSIKSLGLSDEEASAFYRS